MCPSTFKNEILIGKEYTKDILASIDNAHKNIYIFMYDWRWYKQDFSCDMSLINQALVRAVRRGVMVTAILNSHEIIETLRELGMNAIKFNNRKLMHAKAIVIDEWITYVGSHNFSEMAMGLNIEISQRSEDEYIAKKIITYFASLFS